MSMMRTIISGLISLWLCIGAAQAAHITDQLVVGLYANEALEGEPIQVLTTGTPLDVLQRGKGVMQVRLADDTQGWVEAGYVTEDKPARMMLLEAQAEIRRLKAQGAEGKPVLDDASLPTIDLAKVQAELKAANKRIAMLEKDQAELLAARIAQAELEDLRDRVAEAAALLATDKTTLSKQAEGEWQSYLPFAIAVLAVLIGFAAGMAFIDYRIRKRYGGFRI